MGHTERRFTRRWTKGLSLGGSVLLMALSAIGFGAASQADAAATECQQDKVVWTPADGTVSSAEFSNLSKDDATSMSYTAKAPWYPYKLVVKGTKGGYTDELPSADSFVQATNNKGYLAGTLVSVTFYTTTCVGTAPLNITWNAARSVNFGKRLKVTATLTTGAEKTPVKACIFLEQDFGKHHAVGSDLTLCSDSKGKISENYGYGCVSAFNLRIVEPKNPVYATTRTAWHHVKVLHKKACQF